MLLFRHSLSRANIALFLSLVCVAALANSASATVTIIAAQRIVTVLQTGGGQDSDNSFAASGAFTETASVEVLPTGSNNFGSLFAEQDTTINALS